MPSEAFVDALNEQIANEFATAHPYVAIGVQYEAQTFPRLAHFFYEQADEERDHAMKMVRHLLDTGAEVKLDSIEAPSREFADHVAPIALALEQSGGSACRSASCSSWRARRRTMPASG